MPENNNTNTSNADNAATADGAFSNPAGRKVSFLLATYNEKETICPLISKILATINNPLEVIVVDDNSPDGTAELIRSINDNRVKVIRRTKMRGLGSAYMRGIIESTGDIICWMDADGCMPVEMVPEMINKLSEYDAVIGSRFVGEGTDERDAVRVIASKLITGMARVVLGCKTKDIDSGFMVMRRSCLDAALFSPTGYGEYFIELVANMEKRGLKILETGFLFRDRDEDEGESKSFQSWLRFLALGSKYALRILRCKIWPL